MSPLPPEQHLDERALNHARADFVRISAAQTAGDALAQVQRERPAGRIVYFYVVDDEGRLQGVVPTRRLLLSPPDTPVKDIMVRDVVTLPADATVFDACELFIMHRFLALPIVDHDRRMLGAIDVELYTDEISDLARREESEDVFQIIGVRLAEVRGRSIPVVFRQRFPWLLCNIGGGLACALLGGVFQSVLAKVVALALFIPVVLALAESVSIQTLTLTLQSQHGLRFGWREFARRVLHEAPVGLLLGLASGLLVASVAGLWQQRLDVAGTILASMALSVATAALFGLLVPAVLGAFRRDPKVASGPIVLALTDTATLCYYLGLATWWLG
ncbi:MAG TPA: magnesium transporter [Planctomycetaceae bacterium]|nr:magnesium transporter [Planctomycetaceae bacterium]